VTPGSACEGTSWEGYDSLFQDWLTDNYIAISTAYVFVVLF
jgi:hypothetical protein